MQRNTQTNPKIKRVINTMESWLGLLERESRIWRKRTWKRRKAKYMRHHLTPIEKLLGTELWGGKLGARFSKQVYLYGYIVDFYCRNLKLAIEVDGTMHKGRENYDRMRDGHLTRWGISVIRIPAQRLYQDLHKVNAEIRNKIIQLSLCAGKGIPTHHKVKKIT